VLVRVAAAGLCHSDLHYLKGDWVGPTPMVLGHEGSGIVLETGPRVEHLEVGDHVVLSWVAPCGACGPCRRGRPAQCLVAANVVSRGGVLQDGTSRLSAQGRTMHHYMGVSAFAEEAVVPAAGAIRVDSVAPLDVISLVGCGVATGVGAVRNTARVEPGSSVVVLGCGGVGLSVVQGARLAGAERIVAVDLRADKTALARTLGATDAVDASAGGTVEAVRELLPDGADYAFDAIGGRVLTEQCIAVLGVGGTAVVVGIERVLSKPLQRRPAGTRRQRTPAGQRRPRARRCAETSRGRGGRRGAELDVSCLPSMLRPASRRARARRCRVVERGAAPHGPDLPALSPCPPSISP
jgi:S-(hydroxymethyl)glutathione dehydrogenase/alcohol dehydrogenase